jgi:hypothetical protein
LNFVDLVSSSAFPAAADILLSYSFGRKRSEIIQLIDQFHARKMKKMQIW